MRLDNIKITHDQYRSSITFNFEGQEYGIRYSRLSSEEEVSIEPAQRLLDYIDFLAEEKSNWQTKYAELLNKYSDLVEKQISELERKQIPKAKKSNKVVVVEPNEAKGE